MDDTLSHVMKLYTKYGRQIRFLAVGGVNTLLDFICYSLISLTTSNIVIVGISSGTIALAIAFITHNYITFRQRSMSKKTAVRFFIFTGLGMWVLRPFLLWLFTSYPSHPLTPIANTLHVSERFIQNTLAFLGMVVIVLVYNYFVYARFVFTDHTDHKNH